MATVIPEEDEAAHRPTRRSWWEEAPQEILSGEALETCEVEGAEAQVYLHGEEAAGLLWWFSEGADGSRRCDGAFPAENPDRDFICCSRHGSVLQQLPQQLCLRPPLSFNPSASSSSSSSSINSYDFRVQFP